MGAVRGALVGSFALVTLYNVSTAKTAGVTTLFGLPGKVANYLVNPNVPLVPDRRTKPAATDSQGNTTITNGNGDTITQHPGGQVTIGGPNGIPVYPNSYSGAPAPNVQLVSQLAALNPQTPTTTTA